MDEKEKILKNITFDDKGNPTPYDFIEIEIDDFYENFVKLFENSVSREKIYDGYQNYNADLMKNDLGSWSQWIDGSYTTKKLDPNDVDVMNVINVNYIDLLGPSIKKYLTKFGDPKKKYFVDGWLLPEADKSDPRYNYFVSKFNHWKKWFGHDRNNNPKGLIVLSHGGKR